MKIFTVCFKYPDRPYYKMLLEVFRKSVMKHMPGVDFISIEPDPPPYEKDRVPGYLDNTFKLKLWIDFFLRTKDNIIFADCDMLAIRNGEHAFDIDFDVAYTAVRQPYKARLNGGIIMTKPTEAAYRFLNELQEINNIMFADKNIHDEWRIERKYAGMNQAAMGCVLDTGINGAKVHKYMTQEWNAVDRDLRYINENTVFVHIKSALRRHLINRKEPFGPQKKIMEDWYSYEL